MSVGQKSSGPADDERETLKAALRTNMPIGTEADLDPPFDRIVWEIWLAANSSGIGRRLDPSIFLALNNLKIDADKIVKMDGFENQVKPEIKKALKSILNVKLIPNERTGIKGRPENARAHGVTNAVIKYYCSLYKRAPTAYTDGNFVNIIAQIFEIFSIDAKAQSIARVCLDMAENGPKNR